MPRPRQISIGLGAGQKIYCKFAERCCDNGRAMTYLLPPLNSLRAFEAAARHLSFKLAAHELHVTRQALSASTPKKRRIIGHRRLAMMQ
jgi:LysR family transcriptional regulator, glycine cleavage system transcriptional activator